MIVEIDGEEKSSVKGKNGSDLVFDSKCSKFAYVLQEGWTKTLVVGDKKAGGYSNILYGQPVQQSRNLLTSCSKDGIDRGKVSREPDCTSSFFAFIDESVPVTRFVFRTDNIIEFYAFKEGQFVKVTVTIP